MGDYDSYMLNVAMKKAYIKSGGDIILFHEMYAEALKCLYVITGEIRYDIHGQAVLKRRRMLKWNNDSAFFEELFTTYFHECNEDISVDKLSREKSFGSFEAKIREDLENSKDPSESVGNKALNDTFGFMFIVQTCFGKNDLVSQNMGLTVLKEEIRTLFDNHDLKWHEKDFISTPKENGYRAYHFIGEDMCFEVQLRTAEMHTFNEDGGAAHLFYKTSNKVYSELEQFCRENKMNELFKSKFILDPPF